MRLFGRCLCRANGATHASGEDDGDAAAPPHIGIASLQHGVSFVRRCAVWREEAERERALSCSWASSDISSTCACPTFVGFVGYRVRMNLFWLPRFVLSFSYCEGPRPHVARVMRVVAWRVSQMEWESFANQARKAGAAFQLSVPALENRGRYWRGRSRSGQSLVAWSARRRPSSDAADCPLPPMFLAFTALIAERVPCAHAWRARGEEGGIM